MPVLTVSAHAWGDCSGERFVVYSTEKRSQMCEIHRGGGTRSENWWGCAAGRWKLDPKRSREKWNLGPKRSNSLRIGSFNTPKDRFGVGGWEKIPQKDRARSCQSEKRGSKPRHICITHHIGSTPPGEIHLYEAVLRGPAGGECVFL